MHINIHLCDMMNILLQLQFGFFPRHVPIPKLKIIENTT